MVERRELLTRLRRFLPSAFSAAFLSRNLRALLARLGQTNGDCLFAALHFPTFAARPALERSLLSASHRALDALARGFAVLSAAALLPHHLSSPPCPDLRCKVVKLGRDGSRAVPANSAMSRETRQLRLVFRRPTSAERFASRKSAPLRESPYRNRPTRDPRSRRRSRPTDNARQGTFGSCR